MLNYVKSTIQNNLQSLLGPKDKIIRVIGTKIMLKCENFNKCLDICGVARGNIGNILVKMS